MSRKECPVMTCGFHCFICDKLSYDFGATVCQENCAEVVQIEEWRKSEIVVSMIYVFHCLWLSIRDKRSRKYSHDVFEKWYLNVVTVPQIIGSLQFFVYMFKLFSCCVKRYQDSCLRHFPRSWRILSHFLTKLFCN